MNQEVLKRNNVVVKGRGERVLLFAHGFGCDQNMWRFVTPAFEDDYKIVVFDYVGCGKSDLSAYNLDRYSSLHGYSQDILDICEALDLKNAIFVGHSVSSTTGILAAIDRPDLFSALVLVCPSPRYINDADYFGGFSEQDLEGLFEVMDNNYIGWSSFLAPVIMKNEDRPELARELEESFCSTDPTIARKFAQATFFSDNRQDLEKLKIKSLILQCSDDAIAPESVGEFMHTHVADSVYRKMKATGHCPHMSHPQETIALIQKFLSENVD